MLLLNDASPHDSIVLGLKTTYNLMIQAWQRSGKVLGDSQSQSTQFFRFSLTSVGVTAGAESIGFSMTFYGSLQHQQLASILSEHISTWPTATTLTTITNGKNGSVGVQPRLHHPTPQRLASLGVRERLGRCRGKSNRKLTLQRK